MMDYTTERENNIIKNIAREIVLDCTQTGTEVTQELADRMVKLKMLNPKNGFTASEVMPRSLTQQLVTSVTEELKQDTPAMNCIRMQVYWESVKMNMGDLKKEHFVMAAEKSEIYVGEMITLEREDVNKLCKVLSNYVLVYHGLGSTSKAVDVKEVVAATQSVLKNKDILAFLSSNLIEKTEKIKYFSRIVSGIRLYLKSIGKGGEGVNEVNDLPDRIEAIKKVNSALEEKLTTKIEDIREVMSNLVPSDYAGQETVGPPHFVVENLPPNCDESDLKYLKQVLAIMLQQRIYLSDISSKLDEIDGDVGFLLKEFNDTLQRLQLTIRDRDAVPKAEVFDDFEKAGEFWSEMQSYLYCLNVVQEILQRLENINKKEHFVQTTLEKALVTREKLPERESDRKKSMVSRRTGSLHPTEIEDFHLEFNGYCAWTLYYAEGHLVPSDPESGIYQFEDQYYSFSTNLAHDLWMKDPQYYLMEVYDCLRNNPELVFLLNAYENLYKAKSMQRTQQVERKIPVRQEETQTVLHPMEELWDRDYTFSQWELKKRALSLSRVVKCVTKSVQTSVPYSHYRASIGLLAAPDKNKESQTKRDSSCNHSTIANYLYGLRGHREDKFCVVELTRPVDETFERQIILEEVNRCGSCKQ